MKLSGLSEEETVKIIPHRTILLGYVGSIAHGTHIPKDDPDSIDDKDLLGVCVAGKENYIGLNKDRFEQHIFKEGEWDSTVYEIRKFFKLLLAQNPNVISLLWLQDKDYIHISNTGRMILENRAIFSSKHIYHSFIGYAYDQLYKMEHMAFDGYMGEKRKSLVKKFGYDCKNAAHLIRLLRMGIEFLTDGILRVFRLDNQDLKDIKSGGWKIEKVKEEASRLFILAQEAFIRSPLPPTPDFNVAEELLINIIERELYNVSY